MSESDTDQSEEPRYTPDAPLTLNLSAEERDVAFQLIEAGYDGLRNAISEDEKETADSIIQKLFVENEGRNRRDVHADTDTQQ